jgi:hypothetical protein
LIIFIELSVALLDDFGAFLVQKLMAAVGTEKLDLFVAKLLIVAIELAIALRTGHPKNFRHSSVPRIFSRKDAKTPSLGINRSRKKISILPLRLCAFAGAISLF